MAYFIRPGPLDIGYGFLLYIEFGLKKLVTYQVNYLQLDTFCDICRSYFNSWGQFAHNVYTSETMVLIHHLQHYWQLSDSSVWFIGIIDEVLH